MPEALKNLINDIALLPGIGEKTAAKLAFFLMSSDPAYVDHFRDSLEKIHSRVDVCGTCGSFKDVSDSMCSYCVDEKRDTSIMCVVEEYQDLLALESTGVFRGRYHVLG